MSDALFISHLWPIYSYYALLYAAYNNTYMYKHMLFGTKSTKSTIKIYFKYIHLTADFTKEKKILVHFFLLI